MVNHDYENNGTDDAFCCMRRLASYAPQQAIPSPQSPVLLNPGTGPVSTTHPPQAGLATATDGTPGKVNNGAEASGLARATCYSPLPHPPCTACPKEGSHFL